jgi:hypothetical protein
MLSGEATLASTEYGAEAASDHHSLRPDATIARLHDPNFASALAALVTEVFGPAPSRTAASLTARLARIMRITIVMSIRRRYHVAGHEVTVPANWDVGDDQLTLDQVSSTYELRRSAASAIAVLADPGRGEQVLGDAVYFLLRSRSAAEMQRELARRKIPWQPVLASDADDTLRPRPRPTTRKRHRSPTPSAGKSSGRRCHLDPLPSVRNRHQPRQQPALPARPSPISGWSAPGPQQRQTQRSAGDQAPAAEAGTPAGRRAVTRKPKRTARSADGAKKLSWASSVSE